MKLSRYIMPAMLATAALFAACDADDDGNYSYLTDEEVGIIEFDTVGMDVKERMVFLYNMNPGDTIHYDMKVKYPYPERLRYRWFYLTLNNYQYQPVQVGNQQVYLPADTFCYERVVDWVCDLKPGQYRFMLMAEDTVSGLKQYYQPGGNYTVVNSAAVASGVYMLVEAEDGNTDVEVLGTGLQLISGSNQYLKYYSSLTGSTLPGKPGMIRGTTSGATTKDAYLITTSQGAWRINSNGMMMMDSKDELFYQMPARFDLQNLWFESSNTRMEAVINDGKLHVLYTNKANDRKWSAPIAGDYEADEWLAASTLTSWGAVQGAIGAYQVIYDKKNHQFRPYYSQASSVSNFNSTASGAWADANRLPADPVKILNAGGYQTYAIVPADEGLMLYRFNFYNRIDEGDLSVDGERAIISLAGAEELPQTKYWASCAQGAAFYYATDKRVYGFTPTSGADKSELIYECKPEEEVTCIYAPGSVGGGWPTSSCCFYIAVWDNSKSCGRVYEYEMDHSYGVPTLMWGPMFAGATENPTSITEGWGRVKSMTWISAE